MGSVLVLQIRIPMSGGNLSERKTKKTLSGYLFSCVTFVGLGLVQLRALHSLFRGQLILHRWKV